ncbi:GNAT superfamily N-acetyltransferase [Nocardia transvalensis]|uniref:GNAT superfamily N-acetyltransferase n=1 Tax=Nocardia transvalensis TaxID=37333 RepID=A0A7W9ULZ6_9NOCA|nr:GNAT family N-acetyltransferase [Nocardia transvalensis]MBB5918091.1 GNAT superfamily N-acetyltransferase [Nocardia transvalensis]
MGTQVRVWRAEAADAEAVARVFAEASADEAVSAWVMDGHPEVAERFAADYAPELIGRSLRDDEVWLAGAGDDIWAVSLWQTVTSLDRVRREAAEARDLLDEFPIPPFRRMTAVTAAIAERHPGEFPHRYLQAIVTLPRHRGAGAGAALVTERTKAAAAEGFPAYLEASTERSSRLYARCGFHRLGDPIPLPDNGPTLLPMWFRG